jgi:hypothetical protein
MRASEAYCRPETQNERAHVQSLTKTKSLPLHPASIPLEICFERRLTIQAARAAPDLTASSAGTKFLLPRFRAAMQYKGLEYLLRQRGDAWEWVIRTPYGPDKTGRTGGTRRWAETVIRRGIDIWWMMNPNVDPHRHAAE